MAQKIDLRIAPALDTLRELERECGPDQFDFAFIDADKPAMTPTTKPRCGSFDRVA